MNSKPEVQWIADLIEGALDLILDETDYWQNPSLSDDALDVQSVNIGWADKKVGEELAGTPTLYEFDHPYWYSSHDGLLVITPLNNQRSMLITRIDPEKRDQIYRDLSFDMSYSIQNTIRTLNKCFNEECTSPVVFVTGITKTGGDEGEIDKVAEIQIIRSVFVDAGMVVYGGSRLSPVAMNVDPQMLGLKSTKNFLQSYWWSPYTPNPALALMFGYRGSNGFHHWGRSDDGPAIRAFAQQVGSMKLGPHRDSAFGDPSEEVRALSMLANL